MFPIIPALQNMFLTKTAIFATVVATQGAGGLLPAEVAPLLQMGGMGAVLLWFMLRSEPRMQKQTEAMERLTKMNGYVIIALESVHPAVKKQVQTLIDEVEEEQLKRKK